jgi:hypothetical protein
MGQRCKRTNDQQGEHDDRTRCDAEQTKQSSKHPQILPTAVLGAT